MCQDDNFLLQKTSHETSPSDASTILSEHVKNKGVFQLNSLRRAIGIQIREDLSGKYMRRSYYRDCSFRHANLKSAGFLGSTFMHVDFVDTVFDYGNFHSCRFENAKFHTDTDDVCKISSAGFHKSVFTHVSFDDIAFFSCGFTDALFIDCRFKKCTFVLSSFENASFRYCSFTNVDMSNLNLEYSHFESVDMDKVVFPFVTVPSIFNGFSELSRTTNNITIYSKKCSQMSMMDYVKLFPAFISFFHETHNYFPLANIYLAVGNVQAALEAIASGIVTSLDMRDFRMVQHFCRIIYYSNTISRAERKKLYENMSNWVSAQSFSSTDMHRYLLHIGKIRDLLLIDDYKRMKVSVSIGTNMDNQKQLYPLLLILEDFVPDNRKTDYAISFSHNSPFTIDFSYLSSDFYDIFKLIFLVYGSLKGVKAFMSLIGDIATSVQDMILKNDQHKKYKNEEELSLIEKAEKLQSIELQALAMEKMKLEIKELEKEVNETAQKLSKSGISVCKVEHFITNYSFPVDERILTYKTL